MVSFSEIQSQAMELTESERARLASNLLSSLRPILNDEDEGVAEALRRDAEMDADPSACMTYEEFKRSLAQ